MLRGSPPRSSPGERMPHVQYWARVRAGQDCPLRQGAWYRVVELTPVEAIVDVNHRLLHIPRAFVQVLPLRPPTWTVVPGPDAGDGAGRKYGVCPSCCARARLDGPAPAMRCPRCGAPAAAPWPGPGRGAFAGRTGPPPPGPPPRA